MIAGKDLELFLFNDKHVISTAIQKNMGGFRLFTFIILTVGVLSCSKFRKLQKSGDWELKYEAAVEYYQKEDYHRAILLLEDILPIIRGTKEAELGNFYLAYSYFYQKQYIISSHNFEQFVRIYGRSEYAMEATYMHAYTLYLQSPDYQLDQTITYEALAAMQNFINTYPSSDYSADADNIIDIMQVKLEQKAYNKAKLYHKLRKYKSAIVAFENFRNDYPDSNYNEELTFLNIEVQYDYAKSSISSRQEERFRNTIDAYQKFIDKYPNSKLIKFAEKIYADSIEEITSFANSN